MILCENCSPRKECTADKNRTECRFYQPMTEQEWLQTADTEQLADVFFEYRYANATPRQKLWMSASEKCIKTDIVEWLKQPHEDTK